MEEIAYVEGRFVPIKEATVSIHDRGFLFGDGVYEVIRAYRGRPFALERHLGRLRRSREAIRITALHDDAELSRIIREGIRRSGIAEAEIYIELTRGAARRQHAFPDEGEPTLVATFRDATPIAEEIRRRGVRVLCRPDNRWGRCDVKSINLLPNVIAKQEAREQGAWEALFVWHDGTVSEGASTNVFIVRDGELVTPPEGPRILSGVTREILIELGRSGGIGVVERPLRRQDLLGAEEMFLSGTLTEVLGVIACDGETIGGAKPGPITQRLQRELRAAAEGGPTS